MAEAARHVARLGRWPFLFAIFFSMLPLGAGPDGAAEGSTLRQLVWGLIFVSGLLACMRQWARFRLLTESVPVTFFLLVLYVAASIAWSPAPYVSFKRAVQVVGVAIIAAALVMGGSGRYRIHQLAAPVFVVGMLLAIGVTATFPNYAFSDIGLRAFMATKNNFGQFSVFALIFAMGYLFIERRHQLVYVPLVLVSIAGLVFSRSITAAISLASVALLIGFIIIVRGVHRTWWPVFIGFALITLSALYLVGLALGFPSVAHLLDFILQSTGKDITLSGRTYLWELMWHEILKHPWLGTGYGGFWLGLEGMSGQIAYLVRWGYPGQAHNGYIDILNELGISGALLLVAFIVQHTINLVRLAKIHRSLALFHTAIFVALLSMNIAEATLIRTTHLWWIAFVASVFEVGTITHVTNKYTKGNSSNSSYSSRKFAI